MNKKAKLSATEAATRDTTWTTRVATWNLTENATWTTRVATWAATRDATREFANE